MNTLGNFLLDNCLRYQTAIWYQPRKSRRGNWRKQQVVGKFGLSPYNTRDRNFHRLTEL